MREPDGSMIGYMEPELVNHSDADVHDDCSKCWCRECGYFEDCIVERPGYDIESKPCPCDGCENGERYMPKELSPKCGNFISAKICRVCGCTENHACPGGCYWVEDDLCSRCAKK